MRDSRHVRKNRYALALLLAVMAIATLGCVPGGTGLFLSPPTAPVDHASVQPTRVRKMGGDIVLSYAPSGAELLTMGGNITITRACGYVAATTMGGDIVIDSLESGARLQSNGGNIRLFLAYGPSKEPRDLDVTVRGGNVRIILAEPVSATFDVELGYGHDQQDRYAIHSDFPLTQTTSGWERGVTHLFQARQHISATGTVGEGSDHIRVRVEGGMVYLSRNRSL
jgi:hypothetical protein